MSLKPLHAVRLMHGHRGLIRQRNGQRPGGGIGEKEPGVGRPLDGKAPRPADRFTQGLKPNALFNDREGGGVVGVGVFVGVVR